MIYFFEYCLNFEFHYCVCGDLYPSESFSSYTSDLIAMFECSLTDYALRVLWHIIWWPEYYNHIYFWDFYYDKAKTFCRTFSGVENSYITFYRYYVSTNYDVGEHVGVWYSIQLWSANLGGSWIECVALVTTYDSDAVLERIFWIINEMFYIIITNCHETWIHCWRWNIVIKVWAYMFYFLFSYQVVICVFK